MIDFELDTLDLVSEPDAAYAVNRELNLAWDIIENTGANLFLTGKAGTGKTTFLKKLRESSSKRMVVLAPTGVAAINASGTTIHSFFQFPISPYVPGRGFINNDKKFLKFNKQKKRLIASLSLLVIDEISMVRPDLLDAVDHILRQLRFSNKPFGGLQVLLIGDLRQLPPVVTDEEWALLKETYASPYFFESHALKKAGYQTVELSVVYRQSDRLFLDILNKIRDGVIDPVSLKALNDRCHYLKNDADDEGFIRLTTHNNRAASINQTRLKSLPMPEFEYEAEIEGSFPDSAFPAEKTLRLKEGAQVMFVKNEAGQFRRYYNGLIGKVESLSDDKIRVRIPDGTLIDVERAEWENTKFVIDEASKKVVQETVGVFRQFPLQLSWAITIHKSQGLTFDKAVIDASHSFAPGQTYVALSRCRSLEGLRLETPLPVTAVIADREVNDFVEYCESNAPDIERVAALKENYLYSLFLDLFDFDTIRINYKDFKRYAMEYLVPLHGEIETPLNHCGERIEKEMCEVAFKFTSSRNAKILAKELGDSTSNLSERIKNGALYFLEILTEVEAFLYKLPRKLDNKTYSERLENTFDQLNYQIRLKKKILSACSKEKLSVPFYLDVKAKAILDLEKENGTVRDPYPRKKEGYTGKLNPYEGTKIKEKAEKKEPKEKKEKKPKGYSQYETLKLFRMGKNIEKIAEERNLKPATIMSHLSTLVEAGKVRREEVVDETTFNCIKGIISDNPEIGYQELLEKTESLLGRHIPTHVLQFCRYFKG